MKKAFVSGLTNGAVSGEAVHLCVDMQRLFADDTPWKTHWMSRVLPRVVALASAHAVRTVFTRFIPPEHPENASGAWERYWTHWRDLTRSRMDTRLLDLVPDLAEFSPPARIVDKYAYSPWRSPHLPDALSAMACQTLVISGGETDICVLATVMGAVDRGYRVIIATDAVCSTSDETHDAILTVYGTRYGHQIELATTKEILDAWL